MDPHEEFDTWAMIFQATIEPDGDFQHLVPGYVELVQEVIDNGHLLPPIEEQTSTFLSQFVPTTTTFITNQGYMQAAYRKPFIDFLTSTTFLVTWLFENDNLDLVDNLMVLFNRNAPFYDKNTFGVGCTDLEKILRKYLKTKPFEQMRDRCINMEKPARIEHFLTFIQIVQEINNDITEQLDATPLKEAYSSLTQFLEKSYDDNFQNTDLTKITQTISKVVEVSYIVGQTDKFFKDTAKFGEKLLKDNQANRRMAGATILAELCKSHSQSARGAFKEWSKETDLSGLLVEQDLGSQLLTTIEPVFVAILKPEHLPKLWDAAQNAHKSQKATMLNIVAKSLKKLSGEEAMAFIDSVSAESASSEMIEFLVQTAKSTATEEPEFALQVIDKVLQIGETGADIISHIRPIITYQLPQELRKSIINACIGRLGGSCASQSLLVIKTIIEKCYRACDFLPANFIEEITLYISREGSDRAAALDVVAQYIDNVKNPLTSEELIGLAAVRDDCFFGFLAGLIDKAGTDAYLPSAADTLVGIFMNVDFTRCSRQCAKAASKFVLLEATKAHQIVNYYYPGTVQRNIPDSPSVEALPISNIDLIVGILMRAPEEAAEEARSVMTMLCMKRTAPEEVCHYLVELLSNAEGLDDFERSKAVSRVLELIVQYRKESEKDVILSDYGIKRHGNGIDVVKGVEVNIVFGDKIYPIKTPLNASPLEFSRRVSYLVGIIDYGIMLKTPSGFSLLQYQTLQSAGITKDSRIIVTPIPRYADIKPVLPRIPSLILSNAKFQDALLRLLDDPIAGGNAAELLNALPDSESIRKQMEDLESFVEEMGTMSPSVFVYCLEVIIANGIEEDFAIAGGAAILVDCLVSMRPPFGGIEKVLEVLSSIRDDFALKAHGEEREIVSVLLKAISVKQGNKEASSLLEALQSAFPAETEEALFADREALISAIRAQDEETWPPFKRAITMFSDEGKLVLFKECSEHLDSDNKSDVYLVQLYAALIPRVWANLKEGESKELPGTLMKLLLNSVGKPTFAGLCEAAGEAFGRIGIESSKDVADRILRIALSLDDSSSQKAALDLISKIGGPSEAALLKEMEYSTERWGIDPESSRRSPLGLAGLRNLNATCYMNSIIQSLYATPTFRELLAKAEVSKPGHLELKKIFVAMDLTARKSVDTAEFAEKWIGWGNRPINVREQQDAFDFMGTLCDQLPKDVGDIIRGRTRNTIENVDEGFRTHNFEDFYGISLEVKGYKDVAASFASFLFEEHLSEYKAESLGKVIDCKKYARVENLPPVVVLQLKRFEFDLVSMRRIKLNDVFEYPDEIDFAPLMSERPEQPLVYDLYATVLHSGTAQGGHYVSLIKKGASWLKCDDELISEVPKNKFFGGSPKSVNTNSIDDYDDIEYDAPPSAFILFYARRGLLQKGSEGEIEYDPALVKEVSEDNVVFRRTQALFSEPFLDFILKQSLQARLRYLIDIFGHSTLGKKGAQLSSSISNSIITEAPVACSFVSENVEKFMKVFMGCSNKQILDALGDVVTRVIGVSSDEAAVSIANVFADALVPALAVWRQIPSIAQIVSAFVKSRPILALRSGFASKLSLFLRSLYMSQRSRVLYENIEISAVFDSFLYILKAVLEEEGDANKDREVIAVCLREMIEYAGHIMQSTSNTGSFIDLMKEGSKGGIVDIVDVLSAVSTSKREEDRDTASALLASAISDAARAHVIEEDQSTSDEYYEYDSEEDDEDEDKNEYEYEYEDEDEYDDRGNTESKSKSKSKLKSKEKAKPKTKIRVRIDDDPCKPLIELAVQRRLLPEVVEVLATRLKKGDEGARVPLVAHKEIIVNCLSCEQGQYIGATALFMLFPRMRIPKEIYSKRRKGGTLKYAPREYQEDMSEFRAMVFRMLSTAKREDAGRIRGLISIGRWLKDATESEDDFEVVESLMHTMSGTEAESEVTRLAFKYESRMQSIVPQIYTALVSQEQLPQTSAFLNEFCEIVPALRSLSFDTRVQLWELKGNAKVCEKFLDCMSDEHKKRMVEFARMIVEDARQNDAALSILPHFFGDPFRQFASYVIVPVSKIFAMCHDMLPESAVLEYADVLFSYLNTHYAHIQTDLSFLASVLIPLADMRWAYRIEERPCADLFFKEFARHTESREMVYAIASFLTGMASTFPGERQFILSFAEKELENPLLDEFVGSQIGMLFIECLILTHLDMGSRGIEDARGSIRAIGRNLGKYSEVFCRFLLQRVSRTWFFKELLAEFLRGRSSGAFMDQAVRKMVLIFGAEESLDAALSELGGAFEEGDSGRARSTGHWVALIGQMFSNEPSSPVGDKIRSALSGAGEELLSAVDEGDRAVLEGIMVDEVEACEVWPDGECDWDGSQELDIGDYGRSGNWEKKPKRRKVRRRVYPVPQIDISRVQRVNFPEGDDLDSSDPESLPISGCEQNNNEEMKQLITENDFI